VLPGPLRGLLRLAGPYGRAAALWGAGDRDAAFAALRDSPRRLAAFALAADQPTVAAAALAQLSEPEPVLAARLARREGRLTDALRALDQAPGDRRIHRRTARALAAEQATLAGADLSTKGTGRVKGDRIPGRVLHLVTDALPTTSAGYTIRTHEIVRAQQAIGLDPHVVTRCGFPVTQGRLDGRHLVELDGIPYHRLLPWVMPGPELELAARLTARVRPSVLHAASNYANARLALALGARFRLPVVYEVRGFWEDTWLSRYPDAAGLADSEFYQSNRDLETRCMLAADLVVTLGEAMKSEIVARGVPASKVLIVPNAVSETFLQPLPDPAGPGGLRNRMGIKPDEHLVGLVSSLVPHEGIGTLLEATRLLRARGVPVRALIVGDGPERAALQRQAASFGLGEAAIFTGRVPPSNVRDFHALLDVFVVPRTPDRVCRLVTPLKPVEAMASGLCVVASEVEALAEIIKHEVTGALTVPQDPVSLADCLEYLLYSPNIRRELGDNARQWAARDRTWAHNAARYQDAYSRLGALSTWTCLSSGLAMSACRWPCRRPGPGSG
jgi:glycosyltransferase involved in cell wall biosynthesis